MDEVLTWTGVGRLSAAGSSGWSSEAGGPSAPHPGRLTHSSALRVREGRLVRPLLPLFFSAAVRGPSSERGLQAWTRPPPPEAVTSEPADAGASCRPPLQSLYSHKTLFVRIRSSLVTDWRIVAFIQK